MSSTFIVMRESIVRVWSPRGFVVGSGLYLGDSLIVTCAHVIINALDGVSIATKPSGRIQIDFPLIERDNIVEAKVIAWQPKNLGRGKDLAILQILNRIPKLNHTELVIDSNYWDHSCRSFGFPKEYNRDGLWVTGILRDKQSNGKVQVEAINHYTYFIQRGYSGSPVWDDNLQGVMGLISSADAHPETKTGFVIPTENLLEVYPLLGKFLKKQQSQNIKRALKEIAIGGTLTLGSLYLLFEAYKHYNHEHNESEITTGSNELSGWELFIEDIREHDTLTDYELEFMSQLEEQMHHIDENTAEHIDDIEDNNNVDIENDDFDLLNN